MTRKELILRLIHRLPDDMTCDRIMYFLGAIKELEREQAQRGKIIDHESIFAEVVEAIPLPIDRSKLVYHRLVISATHPDTEIWLGDEKGYFVQKEIGTLDTALLPGEYSVEFGLGTTEYPISLLGDRRFTQAELEKGPTCDYSIKDPPEDLDPIIVDRDTDL